MRNKRRFALERLEERLCMAGLTQAAMVHLPTSGAWTPTPYRASPIAVDIFDAGKTNLITVTAGAQLVAYGVNASGAMVPVVRYQTAPGTVADIKSTPVVVTNPATGQKLLFAATGRDERFNGAIEDGRVFGWDLKTGQLLPAWSAGISTGVNPVGITGVYGPITSGDLDGDGVPEIVVTSFSHLVTAYKLDGTVMWRWDNNDTILSGAVIADIDRTGIPSVIVGGDSSNNGFFRAGGILNVLTNTGHQKWRREIYGETIWSTPTVADLNDDGYLEIVVGTGLNFDVTGEVPDARARGNYIYAFDAFGNLLPGWPYHTTSDDTQPRQVLNTLAVADLDGNGQLDVIAVDRSGYVHVVQPNGQPLPAFAGGRRIAPEVPQSSFPDDYSSPIVVDINGDGRPEVVAANGPFLRAFDANGRESVVATTNNVDGLPEGIDAAPVYADFYGTGVPQLAFVSWNALNENRPDQLLIYNVPRTTYASPWPMLRRTPSGNAVVRSKAFDFAYLSQVFGGAFGYVPDAATVAFYRQALDANAYDPTTAARAILTSAPVRQAEVRTVWRAMFGQEPDAATVSAWANALATNPIRSMQIFLASGATFAAAAGGTMPNVIAKLYDVFLGRAAGQAELNSWVAGGLSAGQIASAIAYSPEGINYAFNSQARSIFGAAAAATIPADSRAAYAFDYRRGAREEELAVRLAANGGNYAAVNTVANYVRDLYRDVLRRNADPIEVANWVSQLDAGTVGIPQVAAAILNSREGRIAFLQQQFQTLLGRAADAGAIAGLINYSTREDLIYRIVLSDEYYRRVGGTTAGYVAAVTRDLWTPVPTAEFLNAWVSRINSGTPRGTLALNLIADPNLYYNKTMVEAIFRYTPDESQGVLRTGEQATNQAINPDPNLINYLVGLHARGASTEQVLTVLLSSPLYLSRTAYYKSLYQRLGVRG